MNQLEKIKRKHERVFEEVSNYFYRKYKPRLDCPSCISIRELQILYLRFFNKMSLEETGNELDVTRDRIRQLEEEIKKKLKEYFE